MKMLLLTSALAVTVCGAEPSAPSVRQKLHARIMESVPPPPVPSANQKSTEAAAGPALVMKPVVVSESKPIRDVAAAIAREEQNRREEQFSPVNGGTIYRIGPMELGGWWSADGGWTFLRLNKGLTMRQADAAAARLKELQELANSGGNRKPATKR